MEVLSLAKHLVNGSAAHDRVFRPRRRLDGRGGTSYEHMENPLRGDPRFEKIVASLATKE
jgi:hypothetical protein